MDINELKKVEIFDEKTLEDLLRDIYENSIEDRDLAISSFREFKGMVTDPEDLFMNGDNVSKYLKIAQESTDNLIKVVNSVQKILDTSTAQAEEQTMDSNTIIDILEENNIGPSRFRKFAKVEELNEATE